MPDPRIVSSIVKDLLPLAFLTYQATDQHYTSVWSKPNVPLLIYSGSDAFWNTQIHKYHNGTLAGAAGGHPVQLIYWAISG